jgi:hypothetical protein
MERKREMTISESVKWVLERNSYRWLTLAELQRIIAEHCRRDAYLTTISARIRDWRKQGVEIKKMQERKNGIVKVMYKWKGKGMEGANG